MSIDFSKITGLSDSRGVITQITDASGRVLWAVSGGKVILEVEKITSDTYAGETTYTDEEFILLDIYPKTNGTVTVAYGGLTKTITDTSGAEEPNAQQVFFGTFNGVSDSVTTPSSGELTIEGDCVGFGRGGYKEAKIVASQCIPICEIKSFGATTEIPNSAFYPGLSTDTNKFIQSSIRIPSSIERIGNSAFAGQRTLQNVYISNGVKTIGDYAFDIQNLTSLEISSSVENIGHNPVSGPDITSEATLRNNIISVAKGNSHYKIDGNCLMEIATGRLVAGFSDSIIPNYTTTISNYAFTRILGLANVLPLPASVTSIGAYAFYKCTDLTSIIVPQNAIDIGESAFAECTSLTSVTFENTSGWYVTKTAGGDISTGTAVDVSDPTANATMLTDTYSVYYWYRS